MSGVNKVILVGHLGKDPEVRHLEGGVSIASFPLATSETYTKDGKKIEQTEWHNIVLWRGLADIAEKFLTKGKLVYIEGKLRTRIWDDKEGNKRYTTEVVADNFTMLGRKSDHEGPGEHDNHADRNESAKPSNPASATNSDPADDLPF